MYVGAGIGQQNPSRHLPALSSASGLSPSTVRPSQGWAALPHHLAPSLAHAWRDEEHAESRPSHPVSRQCHPQCSGLPRALGDMGLAQGTAGLAGAGGWTSGHPWAQTADGWDRWTRDRRTRRSGQDVQPGDAGQRGRAQWAAPRRGLCWRRWKGAWPAAARLAVGRVAAAGPHDGTTQWRQRAPPIWDPWQSSAASTQAPAVAGWVQCPSRSLRWWPGTAGCGSAPCDAWLSGPSSPTHPRGVSHCETTPATPRNCVPMPAPLGFPFPRSKWLHGPVGSAAGAAGVSPRLP